MIKVYSIINFYIIIYFFVYLIIFNINFFNNTYKYENSKIYIKLRNCNINLSLYKLTKNFISIFFLF